jgi:hypothetical protein
VTWARVLAGNISDPLVGRDVLIGCASGVVSACLTNLNRLTAWQSGRIGALLVPDWNMFNGTGAFVGAVLAQFANGLFVTLLMLFLYFLLRILLRSDWLAIPLFAFVSGIARSIGVLSWAAVPTVVALCAIRAFVFVRIGLVTAIVDAFVWSLFESAPLTWQTSAWYASSGFATLAPVGALAVYGFKTAIGKQSILDGAAIAD